MGIVPHYVDLHRPVLAELAGRADTRVISPSLAPDEYVAAVAGCSVILSSSLHGLVTADSLGIPNLWIQLSGSVLGAGYKFRDYYGGFGITDVNPMIVSSASDIDPVSLDQLATRYQRPGREDIEARLVAAFPPHLRG